MKRPSRKQARPAVEGLEARVVLSLSPVAAGSGTPFSAIVKLEMTYPDGQDYVGTGAMIDSYHVLTAGHVVYSFEHGGWATSITAIPELHGTSEPFGSAQSTYVRTFNTWINYDQAHPGETSPDAMDVGLITLDKAIGVQTGWLGYGYNDDNNAFAYGTVFDTAGYPASNGYDGLSMEYSSGWIDGLSSGGGAGILFHDPSITVYGGQSGSPVWADSNGVVYGVAVANGFAIRITQPIYSQIQAWTASDTAPVVTPTYPPPTISSQTFGVAMGSSLTLTSAQLLAGGYDPQGLPLSILSASNPLHGSLVKNWWDGSYTYTPYAGYSGTDAFTIQATDGSQNSNVATITINVAAPAPTPPANSTLLVTYASGALYQYDGSGGRQLAGGVQSAGAAHTPSGALVYLIVFSSGSLCQYDATGAHYLAGGVQSASLAYAPSGAATYEIVFTNGSLYQYDSSGAHYLAGNVRSASIAYSSTGAATYEIVFTNGSLYQYDAAGAHYLAGGVRSADAAYTTSGQLIYEISFLDGSLYQYDGAGAHYYFGGVLSASLSNSYFNPNPFWWASAPAPASAPRASKSVADSGFGSVGPRRTAALVIGGSWARMKSPGARWGTIAAAAARILRSGPTTAVPARKPPWAASTI